jgi:Tfp pilus assembly protein PilO
MSDLSRLAASIAVLIVISSYAFVIRPMEATIAAHYSDIDTVRATMERDLIIGRSLPTLESERAHLETRLARRRLHDSRAVLVDRFLQATAQVARRNDVSLQSVIPGSDPARATAAPIEELHLDISFRGAYGPVLRTMRDLNDCDVATQIAVASLGNADRRGSGPQQLNATLHVTLLRESDVTINHAPHSV